jgi:hypothetical protein
MTITDYSFGKITVDGSTYTSDVIIYPDRVEPSWWRKEGHLLQIPDLTDIVNAGLSTVIIGTGFYGAMQVPEKTIEYFKTKNIDARIGKTKEAVKLYNEISAGKPAIAALHLTC